MPAGAATLLFFKRPGRSDRTRLHDSACPRGHRQAQLNTSYVAAPDPDQGPAGDMSKPETRSAEGGGRLIQGDRRRTESDADMSEVLQSAVETIGGTPMVGLGRLTADLEGTILAKLEYFSPGGSKKDRVAKRILEDAEKACGFSLASP